MSLIKPLQLGEQQIYAASLGGLYTSLYVPQLDILLDVGIAIRRSASVSHLFITHAHLDHIGALPTLLGMRGMLGKRDQKLNIYLPKSLVTDLQITLQALSRLHSWPLDVIFHPMEAEQEIQLRANLWVRALKTFHPVPSLGYLFFDRVRKLKPEYLGVDGKKIKQMKESGVQLFTLEDRLKLAYLTDTLIEALKQNPDVLQADTLILECTFLNQVKPIATARAGCHIHLDELKKYASKINSKHVLLMHFSQIHSPQEVKHYCHQALEPILGERLHLCLPPQTEDDTWWI